MHKGGDIIETYYLIDYESVGRTGLSGCDKLSKTDHIHVFYTKNAMGTDWNIYNNHGEAELVAHEVPAGDESLDMHLISYLGYIIGINKEKNCRCVIVSNDKDYDNVIKFWKNKTKVEGFRRPTVKQTAQAKQPTTTKASPSKTSAKTNKADKTRLNQEVQQALSKANQYDSKEINNIAQIVVSCFESENFLRDVHNELGKKYEDYLKVYTTIKSVIAKYASSAKNSGPNKTAINSEIQQLLSKAGMEPEVINDVASVVIKNMGVKNSKQQIYRTIIAKYGQKKGLDIYTRIKKHIP